MSDDFGDQYQVVQVEFPVPPAPDSEKKDEKTSSKMELARGVLADAAAALFLTTVIALVIASLAAAGIITMGLAIALLVGAWIAAVVGTFFLPMEIAHKHRVIFAVFLGVLFGMLGWYEAENYERPLTRQDIAEIFKRGTAETPQGPSPAPTSPQAQPSPQDQSQPKPSFRSTPKRMSFICHRPLSFWRKLQSWAGYPYRIDKDELQRRLDITRAQSGAHLEAETFPDGYRITITPDKSTAMVLYVEKVIVEVRRIDDDLYVTETSDFPPGFFDFLANFAITDPKETKNNADFLEKMLDVAAGTCRLI
jgi:hypothetical protein